MADKKISALTGASTPLAGTEVLPIVQSGATVKVAVSDLTAGRSVASGSLNATGTITQTGANSTSSTISEINRTFGGNNYYYPTVTLIGAAGRTAFFQAPGGIYDCQIGTSTNQDVNLVRGGTTVANIGASDVTVSSGNLVIGTSGKGIDFSATPGTGTSELFADYEEGTWTPTDLSGASLTFTNLSGNCYYTKVGNLVTCIFNITYPATVDVNSAYIGGLPFTSKSTNNAVAGGQFSFTNYGSFLSMAVNTGTTNFYFWTSAGGLITNATASGKIFRGVITYMV